MLWHVIRQSVIVGKVWWGVAVHLWQPGQAKEGARDNISFKSVPMVTCFLLGPIS